MKMLLVETIERRIFAEQYLRSWFELFRVFNIPIPLAGMLVGACGISTGLRDSWLVLAVSACLGCAAIQCFNDYEDRHVDAHNANWRPIPSGRLHAGAVLIAGHLFTALWFLLSLWHSATAAIIVVMVYLLTRWYSRVKRVSLAHHLLLPAALGLMPIYGSLMVHGEVSGLACIAGASICSIDINMNIVGTFKDLWQGAARERVLPVVWGPRPAVVAALLLGLFGILVQMIAVEQGLCGPEPLLPLLPLAIGAILTVHSRVQLLRWPSATVGYAALQSGRLTECLCFPALLAGLLPASEALAIIAALTMFALFGQALLPEARLQDGADAKIG
jgi:4-hydroxybenzoate polyprenyltransferase